MKKNGLTKILAAVISAALFAGTLAGCGAKDEPAASAKSEVSAQASTETVKEEQKEVRKIYAVTGASPRPFVYYGDDNQITGHNYELVTAIFEKLPQYELIWEVTDFPSIFAGLDSDKYQLGVNNFAKNAEREEKYYFTDPMFCNAYIVVANKSLDLPDQVSVEDLAGLNYIGQVAVNTTTLIENHNDANPDKLININYTEEDLNIQLADIESGKYDFTIIDIAMYFGYYQPEFGLDLHTIGLDGYGVGEGMDSYLIISKTEENKQLLDDINKALRQVIEEGKSKEINVKYFGEDFSPSYK